MRRHSGSDRINLALVELLDASRVHDAFVGIERRNGLRTGHHVIVAGQCKFLPDLQRILI